MNGLDVVLSFVAGVICGVILGGIVINWLREKADNFNKKRKS